MRRVLTLASDPYRVRAINVIQKCNNLAVALSDVCVYFTLNEPFGDPFMVRLLF